MTYMIIVHEIEAESIRFRHSYIGSGGRQQVGLGGRLDELPEQDQEQDPATHTHGLNKYHNVAGAGYYITNPCN